MRVEAVATCVLVAVAVLVAAAAGGAAGAAPDDRTARVHIQLRDSGDARWTVSTYLPLDGEEEIRAFEQLGRRFENGTADVTFGVDRFRRYARAARDAADRPMAIPQGSVNRSWHVEDGTGVLVLRFTWTDFAQRRGQELVVRDAFRTESGTWLPRIEEGQVLVIRPPEGYAVVDAPKAVQNATLRWEGPQAFGPDYFHIVFRADVGPGTPTVTQSPSSPTPTDTPPSPPGPDPAQLFVALAALLVGGGAVYLAARRRVPGDGPPDGAPTDGDAPTGAAVAGADPAGDGAGPRPDADEETTLATPEDPFAGVDVELLSDEERVVRLLEANGGRMKQARIVKETGWSNAKVSQLLSAMAEDGRIDKLRIGRENLISLPDVDVGDVEE